MARYALFVMVFPANNVSSVGLKMRGGGFVCVLSKQKQQQSSSQIALDLTQWLFHTHTHKNKISVKTPSVQTLINLIETSVILSCIQTQLLACSVWNKSMLNNP